VYFFVVKIEPLPPQTFTQTEKVIYPSHEILIAEADSVLAVAEEQLQEGFKFDAMLNYHTACVYYRVMESMLPGLAEHVHQVRINNDLKILRVLSLAKYFMNACGFVNSFVLLGSQRLMYSAWRARQCAPLSHNFLHEHFDGTSCADIYEVHGSSKLGKGSYGSVYLASHRLGGTFKRAPTLFSSKPCFVFSHWLTPHMHFCHVDLLRLGNRLELLVMNGPSRS
jgi:hypothetical protein